MSLAFAAQMPDPQPSLGWDWMKANVLAAVISVAAGLIGTGIAQMLGVSSPDAGVIIKVAVFAAGLVLSGLAFTAYAVLVGRVLLQKLPALPLRTWTVVHTVIGLVVGISLAMSLVSGESGAPEVTPSDWRLQTFLPVMAIIGAVVGTFVGLGMGGLQALVLRKAASGLGAWLAWSTVGSAIGIALAFAIIGLFPLKPSLSLDLLSQLGVGVAALVEAAIMLLALKRLRPR